jgi:arylsulfatase A-like enzyme
MTSFYPDVHGVKGFPVPERLGPGLKTLAELLATEGYDTASFTEGGYAKGDFGLDRGFRLYPPNPGDEKGYRSNLLHPSRIEANVERAITWLREDRRDPFFLFFHTYEVHSPLSPPEEDLRFVRPGFDEAEFQATVQRALDGWNERSEIDAAGAIALRRNLFRMGQPTKMARVEDAPGLRRTTAELGVPLGIEDALASGDDLAWLQDLYDAEVRFMDRQIGRLIAALEDEGLAENTVLVVTSDHGESLGERGEYGHGEGLQDELLRVLLLMRVPGSDRPRRVRELVRTVDVMPTLLELVGADRAGLSLQGKSLLPLLGGESFEEPAFGHATQLAGGSRRLRTIRTDRWRLMVDEDAGTAELYDLVSDPGATRDLAAEHPVRVAELRALLADQARQDELLRTSITGADTTEVEPDPDLLRDLQGLGYTGGSED